MADIKQFIPDVTAYAPQCPEITVIKAVRQAAIDFCERTRTWRYEDELSVTENDIDGLETPGGSVILDIDGVWFDGLKLTPKTPAQLDEIMPAWRSGAEIPTGKPSYVTQVEQNKIKIVPFQTGKLKYSIFLKPSQEATDLPDYLSSQHRETIVWGALSRVLLMPNQAFSNPQLAVVFGQSFQQKIDGKSTIGIVGQQRAPVRTKASFI